MTDCSNYGDALVGREDGEPRWIRSPEDVHVITELLDDPEAVAFIETRYRMGEPCPVSDAVHAHREAHNTPVSAHGLLSAGLEGQDATQETQDATEAAQERVERGHGTSGNRRGPSGYLCCQHCVEDNVHDVETDGHDVPCQSCDTPATLLRERAEAAEARVAELEATVARVRALAREAAEAIVSGHSHWDSTMRYGAGCDTCQSQRDERDRLLAILDAPKDTTAP